MTAIVRRLGTAANIATGVNTTIYTVPTGKVAIFRSLFQGYDGGVVDASIHAIFLGVGWIFDQKVSQFDSRIFPLTTVAYAGDQVIVQHTQAGQYTMLNGVELDAADAPTLWRHVFYSVQPTQTAERQFVVPAGKRVRVREVTICNHGQDQLVSVYIAGVGHFVKSKPRARVGVAQAVDITANAGETIAATATTATGGVADCHVFFSGLMEDA